jgi:OHCU decarboxylase
MSSLEKVNLTYLNTCGRVEFVRVCGPCFEHSPWIAERIFVKRPFGSVDALHRAMCDTVARARPDEQIKLIAAHPDLVGKMAREGRLTHESAREQAAAGLANMTEEEISEFERYNSAYRETFGFPFVICARENKKEAILAAFPVRLTHSRQQEIQTALAEIAKIARLRLLDAITEP